MTAIRDATTWEDALGILKIRNEVRGFMTRHREVISEEQQRKWFDECREFGSHPYVVEVQNEIVGYGLIQCTPSSRGEPSAALTGAVTEKLRGKGYGRLVFGFLLAESWILGAQPWLEVLATNARALSLYHALGFREVTRKSPEVITMMHFKKS